jgi:hypothetical protein
MIASPRPFRYLADPVCIVSLCLYALNRFVLKPHHIGGWFTHGYLNDVLCLPLFVPMILYIQYVIGLRKSCDYPRVWEIFQNFAAFTIVFQAIIHGFPRDSFPRAIRGTFLHILPEECSPVSGGRRRQGAEPRNPRLLAQ